MKKSFSQTSLQNLVPLCVVMTLAVTLAYVMPALSTLQALAGVLGIGVFLLCLASTEAALYFLVLSMLLSPEFIVGATAESSAGRGVTIRLDDFILLIIGLSWIAKMAIHKEVGFFLKTPVNRPIAFYILTCLIATLWGSIFGKINYTTGFLFVLKYFEYMFVYFMAVNHFDNKQQVRRYLRVMLIVCVIVSLVGLSQIPQGVRISAPFEGERGEPNTLGGYLVLFISITTGLLLTATSIKNRVGYGGLIILFFSTLLFTQSRGSYLAFGPAMLLFLWLSDKRKWVFIALVCAGALLPAVVPEEVTERIRYTFEQGKGRGDVVKMGKVSLDTSTSERLQSWTRMLNDCTKHPLIGFGVTGYGFVDAEYFRVLIETGILGVCGFAMLIFTIFKNIYRGFKNAVEPFDKGLCMGLISGLTGLLVHAVGANTFIVVRIMEPFWFVLAMVIVLPTLPETSSTNTTTQPQWLESWQIRQQTNRKMEQRLNR